MATLKDLSRHLGISITQVSRALNNYSDVSHETREKVKEAAKLLKYKPNMSARQLVSGKSGLIGMVCRNYEDAILDHNFVETVTNLSIEFAQLGKQFLLHIIPQDADQIATYERLIDGTSIDGFVINEPLGDDPRVNFLLERKIPFVLHGRTLGDTPYPYFDIDHFEVGYQLTHHLLQKGHRRISLINGPEDMTFAVMRRRGYEVALKEFNAPIDTSLIANGHMCEELGLVKTIEIIKTTQNQPTAIVSSSVRITKGIYQAAAALRLRIPDDLSVATHDDVIAKLRASAFDPPLTVTQSGPHNSWGPLANYLHLHLQGAALDTLQTLDCFTFIERESVCDLQRPQ